MSNTIQNEFAPDYLSPPGETLLEALEERGMSQAELAERTGRPKKTINEVIKGKAAITADTALQLERVLGIPARFWNNREQQYREALARLGERERLKKQVEWLKQIPVKEMVKRGWIQTHEDKIQQLQIVLNFFGVASPEQWREFWGSKAKVVFRKSALHESDFGALTAWLRQGEIEAQRIPCVTYRVPKFKQALQRIRALTVEPPEVFQPEMIHQCAEAGVAVVFVPELSKTRVSGATRWLAPDKALIQLSLRYKTDDHLWFSFFHEAGHLLLHQKREVFLEVCNADQYPENSTTEEKEEEANRFAADFLMPPSALEQFLKLGRPTQAAIKHFASEIGIAPGIVVGRLQHDNVLPYNHHNVLKRRLAWARE